MPVGIGRQARIPDPRQAALRCKPFGRAQGEAFQTRVRGVRFNSLLRQTRYDTLVAMLAAAALLIAMYPDWVPARWPSADPKSLELLANTPVNCLWLERAQWSAEFG